MGNTSKKPFAEHSYITLETTGFQSQISVKNELWSVGFFSPMRLVDASLLPTLTWVSQPDSLAIGTLFKWEYNESDSYCRQWIDTAQLKYSWEICIVEGSNSKITDKYHTAEKWYNNVSKSKEDERERRGGQRGSETEVWIDIFCWQLTSSHAESSLNDPSIEHVN